MMPFMDRWGTSRSVTTPDEISARGAERQARRAEAARAKAAEQRWERWKTVAGWIAAIGIPLGLGIGGWLISLALKERESQARFIELSVSILSSEPKPLDDYKALRRWAVDTLGKYSEVQLPDLAKSGLANSLQLTGKGLAAEVGITLTTLDSRRGTGLPLEMSFGNLVTDALRAAFAAPPAADFAIITSDSFRGKKLYPPGTKLTRGDFLVEMPFSNTVTLLEVTGDELRTAIEETANQSPGGGIPQVSGLSLKYSESNGRIAVESMSIGNTAISPDKVYAVATTDFDAAGHIRLFKDLKRLKHPSAGRHIYDIVLLHMYDERTVAPTIEGRIARVSK